MERINGDTNVIKDLDMTEEVIIEILVMVLGDTGSGKAQISTGSSASVGGSGTGVIPQQAQQIPQCRDIKVSTAEFNNERREF
jgi:hypothetical protein